MATSPHSNPEVAGSSLARSQFPYCSEFTPDSGLLGGGLRGGITSAVGGTVEYPPPPTFTLSLSQGRTHYLVKVGGRTP
ncbi:hypothetical protein Hanom_Chr16g01489201 [Helianthus anomalus]